MRLTEDKISEIFYLADEFCLEFERTISNRRLGNQAKRKLCMSQSEVITVMVIFHYGAFKNLKHFYQGYVRGHLSHAFPNTVSYNRFVELSQLTALPMALF